MTRDAGKRAAVPESSIAPRLAFERVTRRFAGTPAVTDLSFTVEEGEVVCLLGPSGSGKTTTLRLAAGVERPEAGTIRIAGEAVAGAGAFVPPERRSVGLMFQDYALFPHLTVLRNVGFGLADRPPAERRALALEALERVRLAHLARAYPHELSGGEQQRVALARALSPRPLLMLMDEPFSGLDPELKDEVRAETMALLRAAATATLIVTHDPVEALAIADRIVLLRAGRLVQAGAPETVWADPADAGIARFFSRVSQLRAEAASGVVETPFGQAAKAGIADGPVQVLVRPRDLKEAESGGAAVEVISAEFLGAAYRVLGRLPSGETVEAEIERETAPEAGSTLRLSCALKKLLIFPV